MNKIFHRQKIRALRKKNELTYLFAAGINAVIPFFALPLLTRELNPSDFGVITTFTTITLVVAAFFRFEINTALKKLFAQNIAPLKNLFGATLTFTAALFLLAIGCLCVLQFSNMVIGDIKINLWVCVMIVAVCRVPPLILHNYWHISKAAMPYAVWSISALGGTHLLTLLLVLTVLPDWRARIFVDVLIALISFSLALIVMRRKFDVKLIWNMPLFAKMGKVAAPIFPGALVITVLFSVDRLVLMNFVPMHDLGIYSIAAQFSGIITLLFTALNPPFEAWAYESIRSGASGMQSAFIKKISQFAILGFMFVFIVGALIAWFLPYWVAPEFTGASSLVIPLMLAFCFFGLFRMMAVCLICLDKLVFSSALSCLTLILIGLILTASVPIFGIYGAAYGLLFGFAIAALSQFCFILVSLNVANKI